MSLISHARTRRCARSLVLVSVIAVGAAVPAMPAQAANTTRTRVVDHATVPASPDQGHARPIRAHIAGRKVG